MGSQAGAVGSANLSGGSLAVAGVVLVGSQGTGIFNQSGGTLSIGTTIANTLYIGEVTGSNGTFSLSGSGVLNDNGDEIAGFEGNGVFNQTGGVNTVASASSPFHLYIGFYPGETGVYSLNGGTLNVFGGAYVGGSVYPTDKGGTGLLNISSGSATISGELAILNYSGGTGVNLTGGTLSIGT